MTGKELVLEYEEMFGEYPFILKTVDIEDENYKEMLMECLLLGSPITEKIINKYFYNKYDIVYDSNKFKSFKKGK